MSPLRRPILARAARDVIRLNAHGPDGLNDRMDAVAAWAGLGYPAGGSGHRGGSDTSLPERLATALADHEITDLFAADLADAEARLARLSSDAAWLRTFVIRHTPTTHDPDAVQTGTCADCGRIVACTPADRLRAGLCDRCRKRKARALPTTLSEGR